MEVDWDLHAVVRGCNGSVTTAVTTSTTTTTTTATSTTSTTSLKEDFDTTTQIQSRFSVSPFSAEQSSGHLLSLPDPFFEARNAAIEELHELYKPFFPKSPQPPISPNNNNKSITSQPISSIISSITSSAPKDQIQLTPQRPYNNKQSHHHACSVTSSTAPRKRRKNQLKRVCHVPAEALSSDIWAWRKYGQKPIKGSPYPRGYYRCSSSKGCLARKQVERNRSDSGMFIVTYTAEHNHPAPTHRNSLAGSTRQKPSTSQSAATAGGDSNKPSSPISATKPTFSSSSPATSMEEETVVPLSTNTESRELDIPDDEEEEEDELAVSDFEINDDFFAGLEGLGSEENLPDQFPASFGLPSAAKSIPNKGT